MKTTAVGESSLARDLLGDAPPPGVQCPVCRRSELDLRTDGQGRAVLTCAGCGTFLRLLRRHGDPAPGLEPCPAHVSQYALDAPPQGSWWIGMIRQRDEVWRAVALTAEHGRCWDSLLTYPGEGDRLTMPCDPPHRVTRQRVTAEDDER